MLESLGWLRRESPLTVTVVDNYALIYGRADTILPSEPCGIDVGRMTAEASNARWAARGTDQPELWQRPMAVHSKVLRELLLSECGRTMLAAAKGRRAFRRAPWVLQVAHQAPPAK